MVRFALAALALATVLSAPTRADHLPGYGDLSGKVTGQVPGLLTAVYATHTGKNVTFMVYAVGGEYRAVNLIPGSYQVTLKPALGQVFRDGFAPETKAVTIAADGKATVDFALKPQAYPPDYVGGMSYTGGWADEIDGDPDQPESPDAVVEPYEKIFPPGRGRDLLETICMGCHTPNLYAYNYDRRYASGRPLHDKDGWAITIDRMNKGVAFQNQAKASYFDETLLPPADYDILVDYLADNFGVDAAPRAVQLESEPELDEAALAKAQFVEYRFPNTNDLPKRGTHTLGFDPDGNVLVMDRNGGIVWLDPRTGESKDYPGRGGGESLAVDFDGTVWYGGVRHFDRHKNIHDQYAFEGGKDGAGRAIPVSTQIFDRNGDMWLSLLSGGGLAKFDRSDDTIVWWDVPHLRSRPYGITLDHDGKIWFAEYHNSGVGRFDPATEEFTHFEITKERPTNMRRLGADSKNNIWTATWGSRGYQNGSLFRLDPRTREVKSWHLGIPYSNPYDTAPDNADNVWIATDNYVVMFDPKTEKFTRYPVTVRTDIPRLAVTEHDAVWFALRNAGHSEGYGGTAAVLYPDKDKIKTYAGRYSDRSVHSFIRHYKGAPTPVTGRVKIVSQQPRNPTAYAKALGLPLDSLVNTAGGITMNSGASRE
jgi:streptogramin lyase/mono/diheme cytochrome c family protein